MNKEVTYQEAIDMLNGLCQGLGDAFDDNTKHDKGPLTELKMKHMLSKWIVGSFILANSPEGHDQWWDVYHMIREMEYGYGRPS